MSLSLTPSLPSLLAEVCWTGQLLHAHTCINTAGVDESVLAIAN